MLNPSPRLRVGGDRVSNSEIYTEKFMGNISRMFSIMYYKGGIGLAATQVGWHKNIFIVNLRGRPYHNSDAMVFINPIVTPFGNEVSFREGCLSIPGIQADVIRPEKVNVEYNPLQRVDKTEVIEASGLLARVIQHEYDHLNGELFIDKLSKKEKRKIMPALRQQVRSVIADKKKKLKKGK